MNDDDLLETLAKRARERWSERSAARDAKADALDTDGAPLTEDEEQAITNGVLARLEAATPSSLPEPAANEPPGRWRRVGVSVGLALVAAVLLWRGMAPTLSALPAYEDVGFEGGTALVRGHEPQPSTEPPQLLPDGELRWRLRPSTAVDGPVELRLLAEGDQRRCLSVNEGLRISASGAMDLYGRVGTILPLAPGEWTLTAIVGRTEAMTRLDDPCAWRAEGRPAPEGIVAAGSQRVRLGAATR